MNSEDALIQNTISRIRPAVLFLGFAVATGFASPEAAAAPVNLVFANNVQATNGTAPVTGEAIITNTTVHFEEVAAGVDLRITISTIGSGHVYNGLVPNRNPPGLSPSGDIAFYYTGNSNSTGGISINFAFFQSDNTVNGTVQLVTPVTLDAQYTFSDADGEATQTERVRGYYQDGLRSYQLSNTGSMTVNNNGTGIYTFTGNGVDRAENDRRGAVILNYESTSSFTLQLESTTTGAFPNTVFTALDGNASIHPFMINGGGGFGTAANTSIPEPGSLALLGMLMAGLAGVRRCKSRKLETSPLCQETSVA